MRVALFTSTKHIKINIPRRNLITFSLILGLLISSCIPEQATPAKLNQDNAPSINEEKNIEADKTPAYEAKQELLPDSDADLLETATPVMVASKIINDIAGDKVVETATRIEDDQPDQQKVYQPTATMPEEFYIRNISGHKQYYDLGCEASAAIDWANYFGVTIIESEFQNRLPLSDNPDYGFVGSVYGPWGQVPPYAYGIHAGPVADLLKQYGLNARGEKNFTVEKIKIEVASGQPVIAWVIGNVVGGVSYEYEDSLGRKTTVAAYEHVVIVTGYSNSAETLRYMNNGKFYDVPIEYFVSSWSVLEKMVVYIDD